ncbi:hypothetical protein GGR54DRAFT_655009 [Hypoxylon sp. NC1633]|nr:hypothetical protein GGR54DRAFT_655009 [Hypoxylon sp. NC1633]
MNRSRPARSKTGCSSCRRRKVRYDEAKPICSACTRLSLTCSYDPGRAPNSSEILRYRVRFVNSRYSKLCPDEIKISQTPPTLFKPPQKQSASESECNCEVPSRHTTESCSSTLHPSTGSDYRATLSSTRDPSSELNAYESYTDTSYVPAFFDLNMNFDLLGEDWFSQQTPSNASPPESVSCGTDVPELDSNIQGAAVIVGVEDHRLIQHYLNVMTSYAKIRCSGDENIYSHIFSNMALFYAPLYHAIMAWTALHLGQARSEPEMVRMAEKRYSQAVSLTHRDQDVALHFELSIVTIWFALQFELLAAREIDSFCRHLEFAADLVDAHRRHQKAGGEATPLGHIGSRMLVWLGAYDSRASCIGGAGRLLQNLELYCSEYDFIDAAFPYIPAGTEDLKSCLRLSLELDYMESRIVQLNRRLAPVPVAIWSTIQSGLVTVRERLENDPSLAPIISYVTNPTRSLADRITTRRFNCLLLLATYYGVVITFHRMLPQPMTMSLSTKLLSAELAATYIVRLESWVCRYRAPSPQNVWPRLLFLAGIETTDLAYQDWVIKSLTEAEVWGANFRKTRLLLERIIKLQSREGRDADLFIV